MSAYLPGSIEQFLLRPTSFEWRTRVDRLGVAPELSQDQLIDTAQKLFGGLGTSVRYETESTGDHLRVMYNPSNPAEFVLQLHRDEIPVEIAVTETHITGAQIESEGFLIAPLSTHAMQRAIDDAAVIRRNANTKSTKIRLLFEEEKRSVLSSPPSIWTISEPVEHKELVYNTIQYA